MHPTHLSGSDMVEFKTQRCPMTVENGRGQREKGVKTESSEEEHAGSLYSVHLNSSIPIGQFM